MILLFLSLAFLATIFVCTREVQWLVLIEEIKTISGRWAVVWATLSLYSMKQSGLLEKENGNK